MRAGHLLNEPLTQSAAPQNFDALYVQMTPENTPAAVNAGAPVGKEEFGIFTPATLDLSSPVGGKTTLQADGRNVHIFPEFGALFLSASCEICQTES